MPDTLLKFAKELYSAKGAKLSLAEIATAAGVSRPTIYKRLGNKAEILALVANTEESDIESRIMDGVELAAANHGFKLASIETIAQFAEVGSATIYRRFGDKDTLIRHFIATRAPINYYPDIVLAGSETFEQNLTRIVSAMLKFMGENKILVRLVFSGTKDDRAYLTSLRDQSNSMRLKMEKFFHHYQSNNRISQQVHPRDLAINLFGMIHAHAILTAGQTPIDIDQVTRTITQMFAR